MDMTNTDREQTQREQREYEAARISREIIAHRNSLKSLAPHLILSKHFYPEMYSALIEMLEILDS